jgi:hypothetical protein
MLKQGVMNALSQVVNNEMGRPNAKKGELFGGSNVFSYFCR